MQAVNLPQRLSSIIKMQFLCILLNGSQVNAIKILHAVRGEILCIVKQPASSWAFHQPEWVGLIDLLQLLLTGMFCVKMGS